MHIAIKQFYIFGCFLFKFSILFLRLIQFTFELDKFPKINAMKRFLLFNGILFNFTEGKPLRSRLLLRLFGVTIIGFDDLLEFILKADLDIVLIRLRAGGKERT